MPATAVKLCSGTRLSLNFASASASLPCGDVLERDGRVFVFDPERLAELLERPWHACPGGLRRTWSARAVDNF